MLISRQTTRRQPCRHPLRLPASGRACFAFPVAPLALTFCALRACACLFSRSATASLSSASLTLLSTPFPPSKCLFLFPPSPPSSRQAAGRRWTSKGGLQWWPGSTRATPRPSWIPSRSGHEPSLLVLPRTLSSCPPTNPLFLSSHEPSLLVLPRTLSSRPSLPHRTRVTSPAPARSRHGHALSRASAGACSQRLCPGFSLKQLFSPKSTLCAPDLRMLALLPLLLLLQVFCGGVTPRRGLRPRQRPRPRHCQQRQVSLATPTPFPLKRAPSWLP